MNNALTTTVPNLEKVTDKYAFVPTATVIEELSKLGFEVASASVGQRGASQEFGKHSVRLRSNQGLWSGNDVARPEAVFLNSHDGSLAALLAIGFHVRACSNGLVTGASIGYIRVRHVGLAAESMQQAIDALSVNLEKSLRLVTAMQSRILTAAEEVAFNYNALKLREGGEAVTPTNIQLFHQSQQVLAGQESNSLWDVFNRAQSAVLRGGYRLEQAVNSRRPVARPIRAVGPQVKLNRDMWTLAESFLQAA
jgi:hypothetical protein